MRDDVQERSKARALPLERRLVAAGRRTPAASQQPERSYTRNVKPCSDNQRRLLESIDKRNLVVAVGPAGTGKTFLAIAKAVEALEEGKTSRIILSRPAVEAGESLGFLPGALEDKLAPYLRPLYDALSERLGGNA
jgi:phosphate starvation-inducible PhoH-like protein